MCIGMIINNVCYKQILSIDRINRLEDFFNMLNNSFLSELESPGDNQDLFKMSQFKPKNFISKGKYNDRK